MPDSKVTALTAITTATSDDALYIVDDPTGTPLSRRITTRNFLSSISSEWLPTHNHASATSGGAVYLGVNTPADIASSGTAGGASIGAAHSHVHRGVLSINASGNTPMYGATYLSE